ncbi:conserved hypothetical membrane protein [Psychromonas ingrahamii 37]|uniref:Conserved hypothetical membrane protein n=1 Tax=Psychromonas ingrahamii (strain DSM 17664 / CCUG 51855 / 37) TaxID=357804 RepID=A1SYQ3_PSYIN|nr:cytochrome b/b6 domain-containing protein [Psychromonas ingrahamii]ABM04618.1 conserved hypothetical membrane protein [Psychromonas ingrahamii 37]
MNPIKITIDYLRERQSFTVLVLHITILILVLSQILVSDFMGFNEAGEISQNTLDFYGTWIHIITGLSLIPITLIFIAVEIKKQGVKHFFPYLFSDFSQLKSDLFELRKFKIPEVKTGGLGAIIEGLGLGALSLVLLSGSAWYLSWNLNGAWTHNIKDIHELFTGLVQAYVIGHGCMGLIHIFMGRWNHGRS